MGLNKPVDFSTAKLLKEKGFDRPCYHYYYNNKLDSSSKDNWNTLTGYSAPTIAEVVMWLYEKHGIWITSEPFIKSDNVVVYIYKIFKNGYVDTISRASTGFNSIDQSYEAGIEYVLKNLI